ncbi:phosphotransferase [Agreia sp. VKM Ac-1783]|uniref:maltokinase N-terminal cap-like domain-containing protein n=1 Tax=Agreia sp. VKM Ac-1783 TaxID=1938889 RepID=UPI000A2ACF69|nr:phosphotransferase [Agreia sp. VKM Ac-1783]SMQ67991.1 Predicted trehalose synthase [Agreia sp. VKM Ac-1783]
MSAGAVRPDRRPNTLPGWVARQRWYQSAAQTAELVLVGEWLLPPAPDGTAFVTHLLRDGSGDASTLYQVPLAYRSAPRSDAAESTLVGTVEGDVDGSPATLWVYDAPHDPAYCAALLAFMLDGGVSLESAHSSGAAAAGHRHPTTSNSVFAAAHVLRGEQSNTSIIFETVDSAGEPSLPVICKVFRTLHHGENPDIVVQSALAEAGCTLVPPSVGYVSGVWRAEASDDSPVDSGHLAFAQRFLPGVRDAWRVALEAAEQGEDFSDRARSLGAATAEVHAVLADILPTVAASTDERAQVAASMRRRLGAAVAEVPELEVYASAVDAIITRAESAEWPRLQRIHGDYHLGQVVAVPDRGWVLLDFEGEPLRPLAERSQPDLTLRDVAGMLRSFDYVSGSYEQAHPGESARDWASASRAAFLQGYSERAGIDVAHFRVLLDALEIDKALYESIYEARNRPAWLPIPVTAISRLIALP